MQLRLLKPKIRIVARILFRNPGSATRGAVLLCALLAALAVHGEEDNGSDRPVRIYTEGQRDGGYMLYADNLRLVPSWLRVTFSELENLEPSVALPFYTALPPKTRRWPLFSLAVQERRDGHRHTIVYRSSLGDPSRAAPDGYLYLFPFAHGTKQRITQGFNGSFSHFDGIQYALDFDLDAGTPVHAARDGLVVKVKEDSNMGGVEPYYKDHSNNILIAHADGTFSNYSHLRQNGALVFAGQRVRAGDLIGYSGATGIATGPHLHFDLRIPQREGGMKTVPMQFRGLNGTPTKPRKDGFYYSYHPGKPPFKAIYGDKLHNADFVTHEKQIAPNQKIDFRTERIDLSYAVFVANGFTYEVETEIEIELTNMTADRSLPVKMRIPAQTELFLTLLRVKPDMKSWRYAPSAHYRRVH